MNFEKLAGGSYAAFTAETFLERKINSFEYNLPVIIHGITAETFAPVWDKALDYFGAEAQTMLPDGSVHILGEISYADFIVIRLQPYTKRTRFGFGDVIEIIRRLRDPDGCPWDKAQTYQSIRTNALEEAYELIEAVDLNEKDKLMEESGDVILQGLFHASIAEDNHDFNVNDVLSGLAYKLVSRHTHIFGENKADNAGEALMYWEKAKAEEKGQKSIKDKLDSIPKTFPALLRTLKVQKIIKKTGFEFPSADAALEKVKEETQEFVESRDAKNREEEGGDLLFSVVNLLRMYGIDPELALNATTDKFIRRFLYVEKKANETGKKPEDCTLEQMEGWYQEYKRLFESNADR